jgi:hypothetical protein
VYVARFIEGDARGREVAAPDRATPDGRSARALFVVRRGAGRPPARILYKLPLFTYHAYNLGVADRYDPVTGEGGWSLYNLPRPTEVARPVPPTVHLHRPGGGTGATPYDTHNWDPFDPTPRQTFIHWDAPFIAWLERRGWQPDYCTDFDLHREGRGLLDPHRLLLSAGHDEYWSDEMRGALEGHVAVGGNAAFFSGNTMWWRVEFDPGPDGLAFRRVAPWHELGRPENAIIGVSFRNGGERDRDEHPVAVGYRVQHADHWAFAGTGLADGDRFGDRRDESLVGYEADGAEFDRAVFESGGPAEPTGADGTPRAFTILGIGDTRPSGWGMGNGAATMGVLERRAAGTVFNAATTDWPRVVAAGGSPAVEQITHNVLERLAGA